MEKSKTDRSPWVKSMKKPGPKKRKRKGSGKERGKSFTEATKALGSAKCLCRLCAFLRLKIIYKSAKHNLPQRPHFGYESSPNVLARFD